MLFFHETLVKEEFATSSNPVSRNKTRTWTIQEIIDPENEVGCEILKSRQSQCEQLDFSTSMMGMH